MSNLLFYLEFNVDCPEARRVILPSQRKPPSTRASENTRTNA